MLAHKLKLQRNLSNKGLLRGGEKKINPFKGNEREARRVSTSPTGNYLLSFCPISKKEPSKSSVAKFSMLNTICHRLFITTLYCMSNMYSDVIWYNRF